MLAAVIRWSHRCGLLVICTLAVLKFPVEFYIVLGDCASLGSLMPAGASRLCSAGVAKVVFGG